MKALALFLGCALAGLHFPMTGLAQNEAAAEIAERREAEERYKRLSAMLEDVLAAQASQQKKLAAMSDELRVMREENHKLHGQLASYASQEELRRLAEKVQQMEKLRVADKDLILDEIKKLAKLPPVAATERKPVVEKPVSGEGYEYTIQPGDTLSKIVLEYNRAGVKVTQEQIKKANPEMNELRLRIGQKIYIPKSAP